MDQFEITAEPRQSVGTRASRRLRYQGEFPAIVYGGHQEPQHIVVNANQIRHRTNNPAFFSHVLKLSIADQSAPASVVVKAVQRDPISSQIIHMDFLRVSAKDELRMNVPLLFKGEDACVGAKTGGFIDYLLLDVEIACMTRDLPEHIEVDISNLNIGEVLHLSELTLPPKVQLTALQDSTENDQPVVRVQYAQKQTVEPEEEDTA